MIDDLWLIKLKIDVKSRNPDMLLEEYIKTTKQELLGYTKVFKKGQILYRGRVGYKSYEKEDHGSHLLWVPFLFDHHSSKRAPNQYRARKGS